MMAHPLDDKLLARYRDPLRFLDTSTYREMRKSHRKQSWFIIGFGLILGGGMIAFSSGNSTSAMDNKIYLTTVLLCVGLPLYGFYTLAVTKRAITRDLRSQLAAKHPELRVFEPKPMVKGSPKTSPMVSYVWIALAVTIVVAIIAILVTS